LVIMGWKGKIEKYPLLGISALKNLV